MNRIKTVSANDLTAVYTYDENGNATEVKVGDNVTSTYTFDERNMPTLITNNVGTDVSSNTYKYDALGMQISKTENGKTTEYAYDALTRLAKIVENDGRTTDYTYDQNGNRKTQKVTNGVDTIAEIEYLYNSLGRLVETAETRTDTTEQSAYTYDKNGNQIEVDVAITTLGNSTLEIPTQNVTKTTAIEYIFNAKNQITSIETAGGISSTYKYYFNSLRSEKADTKFIYSGKQVLAEVSPDSENINIYGNSLLFTIATAITAIETEIPNPDYIIPVEGEVSTIPETIIKINETRETQNLIYTFNGHGDVVRLSNQSGVKLNTYEYDAFGNITESVEAVANTFFYSGYEYDEDTGLYYLRTRYYNPKTARFISEDTFSGWYNDPLSLNKYIYAHNNPISYYDPDGMFIGLIIGAIAVVVAVVVVVGGAVSINNIVNDNTENSTSVNTQPESSGAGNAATATGGSNGGNYNYNTLPSANTDIGLDSAAFAEAKKQYEESAKLTNGFEGQVIGPAGNDIEIDQGNDYITGVGAAVNYGSTLGGINSTAKSVSTTGNAIAGLSIVYDLYGNVTNENYTTNQKMEASIIDVGVAAGQFAVASSVAIAVAPVVAAASAAAAPLVLGIAALVVLSAFVVWGISFGINEIGKETKRQKGL